MPNSLSAGRAKTVIFLNHGFLFLSGVVLAVVVEGCVYHALPEPVNCDNDPVIVDILSVSDTECGLSSGRIEISATGGLPPWQYKLGEGNLQPGGFFDDLRAGTYVITVIDSRGCSGLVEVAVKNATGLNVAVDATPSGCRTNDGAITVHASGGAPPYRYSLDGADLAGLNMFGNLGQGAHSLRIVDEEGCEVVQEVLVPSGVSFVGTVRPVIEANCAVTGCHNGTQFPDLRSFLVIREYASLIKVQVVSRNMPLEGTLSENEIRAIACWVDDGAPDN